MTKKIYVLAVKRNNQRLYLIALSFTKSHCDAENILQNVFLNYGNTTLILKVMNILINGLLKFALMKVKTI